MNKSAVQVGGPLLALPSASEALSSCARQNRRLLVSPPGHASVAGNSFRYCPPRVTATTPIILVTPQNFLKGMRAQHQVPDGQNWDETSQTCWIADSIQVPPRLRRKVQNSVTSWARDGSPSTTRPVVRSIIQSWSENRIATVA